MVSQKIRANPPPGACLRSRVEDDEHAGLPFARQPRQQRGGTAFGSPATPQEFHLTEPRGNPRERSGFETKSAALQAFLGSCSSTRNVAELGEERRSTVGEVGHPDGVRSAQAFLEKLDRLLDIPGRGTRDE
jgi:hypothetical protein